MVSLSQCMIVKNEEANIARALSWARGLAAEQIVVDTGSTDRTVEIAASMGAKIFHFPWIDDFAAAKNFAIEQARGEWIALLDADEYMKEDEAKRLRTVLERLSPDQTDGVATAWVQLDKKGSIVSQGTQVRVFANRPYIRYHRAIHEQLERTDGRRLRLKGATERLAIFHTGYAAEGAERKEKAERDRILIEKEIAGHGADSEMLGYLGDTLLYGGDKENARKAYREAVDKLPAQVGEYDQRSALTIIALMILLEEDRNASEEELRALYRTALAREALAKDADFPYFMARWYIERQNAEQARPLLEETLRKMERYGTMNRALYASARLEEIYECLATACWNLGDLSAAVRWGTAVLREDPWAMRSLTVLLKGFQKEKTDAAAVFAFLGKLYDWRMLKAKLFVLRTIARCGGWAELEALVRGQMTPEERECYDRSMREAMGEAEKESGAGEGGTGKERN